MNGKKTNTKQKNNPGDKSDYQAAEQEQAATLEHNDDAIPTFARKTDNISSLPKKKGQGAIKPILVSVIAAVIIGSILGFIMLNMIAGIDDRASNSGGQQASAGVDTNDKERTKTDSGKQSVMSAYVLQGGVFAEKENADEWAKKFKEAGLPSVIWEKDSEFYLFAGIADSKEQAKEQAESLQAQELDVFAKEWETDKVDQDLTETESSWLKDFQEQWSSTLTAVTKEQEITADKWQQLVDNQPEESQIAGELAEEIENSLGAMEGTRESEIQGNLLSMWQKYESLFF